MDNLHPPGTPLYLARLHRDGDNPAVAAVLDCKYHAPAKTYNHHTVKLPHHKFPLEIHADDLKPTAAEAQARLVEKIRDAINAHAREIDALHRALAEHHDSALIDWSQILPAAPTLHAITLEQLMHPTEPTIVATVADLQKAILARAHRNRTDRALVVDDQRRALDHAADLQQVAARLKREPHPELLNEIPPLAFEPQETAIPAATPHEPRPIEPTPPRPIPSTPGEDDRGDAPPSDAEPRHARPKRVPPQ